MISTKCFSRQLSSSVRTILYGSNYAPFTKDIITPTSMERIGAVPVIDCRCDESSIGVNGRVPSISLILNASMDKESRQRLDKWTQKQVHKLGHEGYEQMMNSKRSRGSTLHKCVHQFLGKGASEAEIEESLKDKDSECQSMFRSVFPVLKEIKQPKDGFYEQFVTHWQLGYLGKFDAICTYKDNLYVMDWKATSMGTVKSRAHTLAALYDDPVQLAAYIGAINSDPKYKQLHDISRGMLVLCKDNGSAATVVELNAGQLEQYWESWVERVKYFWDRISKTKDGQTVDFLNADK